MEPVSLGRRRPVPPHLRPTIVIFAAPPPVRHAHHRLIPAWVIHFGLFGVFLVALLDAAPIPLPIPGSTDILILILGAHGESPWLLAPAAIAGGLVGGYLTWSAGKRGGEKMLERYVPQRFRSRMTQWVKSHGMLSVCVAAALPPPSDKPLAIPAHVLQHRALLYTQDNQPFSLVIESYTADVLAHP